MKKPILILLLAGLVIIVLAIVWLFASRGETKIQNTEPSPRAENTKTQITETENFLEKIGAGGETDVTSILEQKNPLDVFEKNLKPQSVPNISVPAVGVMSKLPKVLSVSPNRVRKGETVTITGENFMPTNNTIFLKDGPAQQRFDGLPSYDGKTITFIYEPPDIKVMTEAEIRALPANIVSQIETPIRAAGKTLTDALKPYSAQGISNETELRNSLERNGHKLDEIYNYFFVKVENSQGSGMSSTALLRGLPKTASDIAADSKLPILSVVGQKLNGWLKKIVPIAYAQGQQGGGFFTTVMICTCGDGYMDFVMDYSGGGSGLWVFSWGFQAEAGFGFGAAFWLGGYDMMTGSCSIYIGVDCIDIMGSEPSNPWGSS